MSKYDIITVDWNAEQTELWLYYVERHCPDSRIILIPDEKPIPWCWSGGKLNCFKQKFESHRIIYMDTDTIVFRDMYPIFEMMDEALLGFSTKIISHSSDYRNRKGSICNDLIMLSNFFGFRKLPIHRSTGMIILNKYDPLRLYEGWKLMFDYVSSFNNIKDDPFVDEIAMSYWIAYDSNEDGKGIWDIPLDIHRVKWRDIDDLSVVAPMVFHYHSIERLMIFGLDPTFPCLE
ncbi:MAG: hypothetical protein SVZ03_15660 [Spirochaetota bacterium]|nr:hypothetical protein [Spirochaetota bacterium]